MPSQKTNISELATALGALGHDLADGLADPPSQIADVPWGTWLELRELYTAGEHADLFAASWRNGRAFLMATDGLRGRIPVLIEWRGPQRAVGRDPVPADLRIDHVYLVSIKERSKILRNASPSSLFDRALMGGSGDRRNWFDVVAPDQHADLQAAAAAYGELPARGPWPEALAAFYADLCREVAIGSAERWNAALPDASAREQQLWSLLRLAPAPYFLLGATRADALRVRVDTPWDWRRRWRFVDLTVEPDLDAGQPQVRWVARVAAAAGMPDEERTVEGIVEVRWSHGRLSGAPEAKIQLRTRHEDVPGYNPLV